MNHSLKFKLHQKCGSFVDERIGNIREALNNASESANDETKSSAGDKHETGRAMAQLEQEKGAKQLTEALELRKALDKINPEQHSTNVSHGSLVYTDSGIFYIAIAAGKITIDTIIYFAISPQSPLAIKMMGLTSGKSFEFNQQTYRIENLF